MFDYELTMIAVLALGAIALAAWAIVRIVREANVRRVDDHVMKIMQDK